MKSIYSIIIIYLLISCISGIAQVRIGAFGGINRTNFNGDDPPNGNYASDYGYNLGTTADFYLLDDVVLNIQPMYSHQSTIIQYEVRYQYDKYDSISVAADYFQIPLNIKVISNNKMSYVTAGISLIFPLQARTSNNRSGSEKEVLERFEPYLLAANFGVGIEFSIGKPMLFVELIYSQSLTNLTKLDFQEVTIDNKLKSNSIQLHTGILFTL